MLRTIFDYASRLRSDKAKVVAYMAIRGYLRLKGKAKTLLVRAVILVSLLGSIYAYGLIHIYCIKSDIKDLTDGFSCPEQRSITTKIVIHHDATNDTVAIKDMCKFHTIDRGWGSISYHYYIYGDRIYHLHRDTDKTVHAGNTANACGIAICLHGNFEQRDATFGEMLRVAIVAKILLNKFNLSPEDIVPHKYFGDTNCPGSLNVETIRTYTKYLGIWL